jgi:GNAT superfamily N-acetyltransferase
MVESSMHSPTNILRNLYDTHMRREAWCFGLARVESAHTVRYVSARGEVALVMWHNLPATDSGDATQQAGVDEVAWCKHNVGTMLWKVYGHDAPPALGAWLEALGGKPEDHSVLHMARIDALLARLARPSAGSARVHATQLHAEVSAAHIERMSKVWRAVWPSSADEQDVWGQVYGRAASAWQAASGAIDGTADAGACFWAAHADGQADAPVGAGYVIHGPPANEPVPAPYRPIALLCGGAVLAHARGQGIYGALLAARAQWAANRGAEYLAIEASPMSAPIVQRLGFEPITPLVFYKFGA